MIDLVCLFAAYVVSQFYRLVPRGAEPVARGGSGRRHGGPVERAGGVVPRLRLRAVPRGRRAGPDRAAAHGRLDHAGRRRGRRAAFRGGLGCARADPRNGADRDRLLADPDGGDVHLRAQLQPGTVRHPVGHDDRRRRAGEPAGRRAARLRRRGVRLAGGRRRAGRLRRGHRRGGAGRGPRPRADHGAGRRRPRRGRRDPDDAGALGAAAARLLQLRGVGRHPRAVGGALPGRRAWHEPLGDRRRHDVDGRGR